MRRGSNRGSFLWGSSTHNTRIERLWGEIGKQFGRRWKAFFQRLEHCIEFIHTWNNKPISGYYTNEKSPIDMYLLGRIEEGVYLDEFDGVPPNVLEAYLGTAGSPGKTGAGHDYDEEEWESMVTQMKDDQNRNTRHEGVQPPRAESPFSTTLAQEIFAIAFQEVQDLHILPPNLGIRADE
ncbi:hypothetical protein BDQ17DRAFT_1247961 [Cyathus striatus]|nr:hypothetical protein BDQ17DRAFT_1247961 [Cyathus striatus]